MDIAEKVLRQKKDFDDVYEAGKKTEYDEFWDSYNTSNQTYSRSDYMFAGKMWNDTTFKPKYDIVLKANSIGAFYDNGCGDLKAILNKCGVKLDTSQVTNAGNFFISSTITALPEIDLSNATNITNAFGHMQYLKSFDKVTFKDDVTFNNVFNNEHLLEEIRVGGTIGQNGFNVQWSTKLTHDSLMSIINALADKTADTSGTEWVVTVGSENKAKLTDDELDIAQNKGWQVK